ncbi:type ISP restriction/modification enzyme [Nitrospina watsonii]|uniref:site-specific DNA-methyltransferase (adenine-specific) n=1 Tax=Nitrospina watsonii TaxID=1323948 RepID=A0ABM9HGT9_9BACT|nr:type ISP restriction/modification enzyme [Nitrospina watsonii]CAI2719369.1 Type_ISP_C domain-containing protein [Nitrospina watsonii]
METYGLDQIKTFEQLLPWLRDHLRWPIKEEEGLVNESFEELTFEYTTQELGLKKDDIDHIREVRQLRPFFSNQPWGIFFVNFEDKRLPVGILKRILRGLTLKKRSSSNKSEQKGWQLHDLLFISAHGKSGERELSFLHFSEENGGKNKIILKEMGWDQNDTKLKFNYVAQTLQSKLAWPEDVRNSKAWREQWAGAFVSEHGAAISTAKDLTKRLASLATNIRKSANEVLEYENENGPLTSIYENFKKTLFHNLDHDGFADMYAQTICYGLLADQIDRTQRGENTKTLTADNAALTASLHPFLKELMETFLAVGGRKSKIDSNELGIDEVVEALRRADMKAVCLDFNNKNPDEDPILHFYEHFLKDYDSIIKEQRGVYYTPLPVVKFIVRSVDEILQKEFGLEDGLADITTWGEIHAKNPEIKIPEGVQKDEPFVQILDPATGTGTFLVEVIDLIKNRMEEKWKRQGKSPNQIGKLWNEYVPNHLLPRLNGFELMMAPYAIAHIKIGLKLDDTGYHPENPADSRLRVYLTNSLEEPISQVAKRGQRSFSLMNDSLAEEARGADQIKAHTPITIVIGNPPYSRSSKNMNKWIEKLCLPYKEEVRKQESQIQGLSNDYIKFIRYMQYQVLEKLNSYGIIGIITGHGYLHGTQPRDMRKHLSQAFDEICCIDLHGSIKKETNNTTIDEPVFDISTGVAITMAFRFTRIRSRAKLYDLIGPKSEKFHTLKHKTLNSIFGNVSSHKPCEPYYFFKSSNSGYQSEYNRLKEIPEFFGKGNRLKDKEVYWSTGFASQQDDLAISFSPSEVLSKIEDLRNSKTKKEIAENYKVCSTNQWNYDTAKSFVLKNDITNLISLVNFRPFDYRYTIFKKEIVTILKHEVQSNFIFANNIGLVISRAVNDLEFAHVFCAAKPTDKIFISSKTSTNAYIFPLYLAPRKKVEEITPNLNDKSINILGEQIQLSYQGEVNNSQFDLDFLHKGSTPRQIQMGLPKPDVGRGDLFLNFGPRDVFDYIYSVLFSPSYRSRYAELLKTDFPRIPLPDSVGLFREMVKLGRRLVAFHLLDAREVNELAQPETRFIGKNEPRVEKGYPQYKNGKVIINPSCHFEDVTPEVYNFYIGGYQPCQKWLKDRAGKGGKNPHPGRVLSEDDILHYRRITIAIRETIRLMREIDEVINAHGGWPDAFHVPPPPPPSLEELLKTEESVDLEYKSTFQWDVKEGKKNPDLRKACLKTIAAFLNSKGGTLVVGVTDDKEVCGLAKDLEFTKNSIDWFEQTLRNVINDAIGINFSQNCNIRFEGIEDKQVCIVEVEPASEPAFLTFQGKTEFFIRSGNATKPLGAKEQHEYIKNRSKNRYKLKNNSDEHGCIRIK